MTFHRTFKISYLGISLWAPHNSSQKAHRKWTIALLSTYRINVFWQEWALEIRSNVLKPLIPLLQCGSHHISRGFLTNKVEKLYHTLRWTWALKAQKLRSKSTANVPTEVEAKPIRKETSLRSVSQSQSLTQKDFERSRKRISRETSVRKVSRIQKVKRALSTMGKSSKFEKKK